MIAVPDEGQGDDQAEVEFLEGLGVVSSGIRRGFIPTGHPLVAARPLVGEGMRVNVHRTVATVGAGPAGIYAADILQGREPEVRIDLLEKLPDIPEHVDGAFQANPAKDVHLFIRRGPADLRFSPMELRELGSQHDVDVIVDPADVVLNEHAKRMIARFSQLRLVSKTLTEWAEAVCSKLTRAVGWDGWLRIDAAERHLGGLRGRERIKIVDRTEMLEHAR
jgi:hypothetical protein